MHFLEDEITVQLYKTKKLYSVNMQCKMQIKDMRLSLSSLVLE